MTPLTDDELKDWINWFWDHKSELVSLLSDFYKIKLENVILYLEPFFLLGIIEGEKGVIKIDINDITKFREERLKRRKEEKRLKKEKKRRRK